MSVNQTELLANRPLSYTSCWYKGMEVCVSDTQMEFKNENV